VIIDHHGHPIATEKITTIFGMTVVETGYGKRWSSRSQRTFVVAGSWWSPFMALYLSGDRGEWPASQCVLLEPWPVTCCGPAAPGA
jgi:hypothetical protein